MNNSPVILQNPDAGPSDNTLRLSHVTLDPEYRKKWNETSLNDFCFLTRNGQMLRPVLYRLGGLGTIKDLQKPYFMLIKHVEAFYPDNITTDPKRKPHLEGRWCILDRDGNEKDEFPSFKSPYLVKDSCLYSIDSNYYNIETGYHYCRASEVVESKDFIFLENRFDDDSSRRGVLKVSKLDGSVELFPG